jgi:hypothetical protein
MRVVRRILLTAGILFGIAGAAQAQAIGQVFGKVTDSTGAVMPGVNVMVAGSGLQQPLSAVTTATGAYSFPSVPIGSYSVTFELSGFKKAVRNDITITTGFSAMVDVKMEIGTLSSEVSVSAAPPVVDTKRTTTGATFSRETMENVPTARDPWQVINMAPGVQLSGVNVGGSASGQQLTPSVYGRSSNVVWNIEGGNTTDMASNSSASYYNFDSFQEIQVVTGGGDVSVQSSGVNINLVTKSGSNAFKGSGTYTFENDRMQGQNVSEALFNAGGSNGTGLSGNPLNRVVNASGEFGGPILRNRLWFWGAVDYQNINVGVTNFFNTSKTECVPVPTGYANLEAVQRCLENDKTLIKNMNGKVNYQFNAAHKVQFLYSTDNKVRDRRGASANTAPEATFQQYSPNGIFAYFTPQLTHTMILSDKLVITNQATHVEGGFSLDFQDWARCGQTQPGVVPSDPTCMYNVQALSNRTTGYLSRGPGSVNYYERPTWEAKSDGSYFLSNVLGGDHQLKFGIGWHEARSLSYAHYGGGINAGTGTSPKTLQCVGNVVSGCGSGAPVAVGSLTGLVPYQAALSRDSLSNVDWWTWSSYIQDSYSRGRVRINGGVRQDWQTSVLLPGCVPANVIRPDLLPEQCQEKTKPSMAFNNFSPRGSATYDLFGNGKTAVHASGSYYYDSRIALAGNLSNLGTVTLTWGPNQSSGLCSATAGASCWNDANVDGFVQAAELTGTPSSSTTRFNPATGVLTNALPVIDEDLKVGRTREFIAGIDHDLGRQMHVGLELIYRNYDLGSRTYIQGYEPGAAGFPATSVFTDRQIYVDPISGKSAPYYTVCQGCTRATGTNMTATNVNYQIYKGVTISLEKRASQRWQAQGSMTYNINRDFTPTGGFDNPTGLEFSNGALSGLRFVVKGNGSVSLPWGLRSGVNLQIQDGPLRNFTINGPGQVYGGTTGTVNYTSLSFEENGKQHLPILYMMDANITKAIKLPGSGSRDVKLTFDAFNIFNVATIRSYSSNNLDAASFTQITEIVAPRVFRVMARLSF